MKLKFFLLSLMSGLLFFSLLKTCDAYVISNGTGGDCSAIGIWDAETKTCTLTGDVYASRDNLEAFTFSSRAGVSYFKALIHIKGNGITLDGNGVNLIGQGANMGIFAHRGRNVTVKNVSVKNSTTAIYIMSGGGNNILNNSISQSAPGILIRSSKNNTISGNTISGFQYIQPGTSGILITDSSSNNMIGNTISEFGAGIDFSNSDNIVKNNLIHNINCGIILRPQTTNSEISNNTIYVPYDPVTIGQGASNNRIYNNNFISTSDWSSYMKRDIEPTNVFNLDLPVGGNYWNIFDSPDEGCNDTNGDGICEEAFSLAGSFAGVDNFPWTSQNGWLK